MNSDENLDRCLDDWNPPFEADAKLVSRVSEQVALRQDSAPDPVIVRFADWVRWLKVKPLFLGGAIAALLIAGFFFGRTWEARWGELPEYVSANYRLSIDPLYRLEVTGGERSRGGTLVSLHLFEETLGLDEEQADEIEQIHDAYRKRFDELFLELAALQRSFLEFDRQRMSTDVIDYMAYRDLLDKQIETRGAAHEATDELLQKVVSKLSPEQKDRFIELLDKAQPSRLGARKAASNA